MSTAHRIRILHRNAPPFGETAAAEGRQWLEALHDRHISQAVFLLRASTCRPQRSTIRRFRQQRSFPHPAANS